MTLLNTDTGSADPTDAVATNTVRKTEGSVAAVSVSVGYGRRVVLSDVDVSIEAGETVGLRGPSGTGKTTLVRILALLTRPQAGHVEIDGVPVRGVRHGVPAATRRRVAVLFQSPRAASDPRLSLYDIVAEPLRASGQAPLVAARVGALAEEVGLTADLLARKPHAVSDGQLQRACLARALAQRPDHLLCDEATIMLDASTQAHLVAIVRRYQAASGAGVLAVSHDDALLHRWADRIVDLSGACVVGEQRLK